MAIILWMDEDLDDFPAIEDRLTDLGADVKRAYTVSEAFRLLLEKPGITAIDCFVVDAIVPIGLADADSALLADLRSRVGRGFSEYRYPGLMLFDAFPKLNERSVVLSIVPERRLRTELPPELHKRVFQKIGLSLDRKKEEPFFTRVKEILELR